MSAEFNIPIGRLNSPAPRFNAALRQCTHSCLPCPVLDLDHRELDSDDAVVCHREYAVKRLWDDDELAIEWTLEPSDQTLLANKAGATRLGFETTP